MGSPVQRKVHDVLNKSGVFEKLYGYTPVLAGTYPLGINIPGSDLDIVCEYDTASAFGDHLTKNFSGHSGFKVERKKIRGQDTVIARFLYEGFKFEIFGQDTPVEEQYAYRHMLIEYSLLKDYGEPLRKKVIALKQKGFSTEEAFAIFLGIEGDPYERLLNY
jgi:hypothetical protein